MMYSCTGFVWVATTPEVHFNMEALIKTMAWKVEVNLFLLDTKKNYNMKFYLLNHDISP